MPGDPIAIDGKTYPDEATMIAMTHPDLPDGIREAWTPKEDGPTKITVTPDDSAAGMAARASEKAADALKSAQGTPPTSNLDVSPELPQDVYEYLQTGKARVTPDEINQAIDVGMAVSGGGMTFAGVKSLENLKGAAKGEALSNIGLAQIMVVKGEKPSEILRKTGFFVGRDGKLRYELDDSKAVFNSDWEKNVRTNKPGYMEDPADPFKQIPFDPMEGKAHVMLPEVLDHPDLYKAYPELKNVAVIRDPSHPSAYFSYGDNTIGIGDPATNTKDTFLHEIQHWIQYKEGFAKGAAWGEAGKTYGLKHSKQAEEQIIKPLQELWKKFDSSVVPGANLSNEEVARMHALQYAASKYNEYAKAGNALAYERYLQSAGEVEARNVEARMLLNAEERRQYSPLASEDVAPELQRVASSAHRTNPYKEVGAPALTDEMLRLNAPVPFRRAANDNKSPREFVDKFMEDLPNYGTPDPVDIKRLKEYLDSLQKE